MRQYMDNASRSVLIGLILLILLIVCPIFLLPHKGVSDANVPPSVHPVPPSQRIPVNTVTNGTIQARVEKVDLRDLALGRISYAYITLTNTGKAPITRIRVQITVGRDFGFPLGYQLRLMIQEYNDVIEPGQTLTLRDAFDLPIYEGIIPLEGSYEVILQVFVNDGHYIGEWEGEVYLKE